MSFILGLIIGLAPLFITALLKKNASTKKTQLSRVWVLIGGIIIFFLNPFLDVALHRTTGSGGAVGLVSSIGGIYFIVWAIRKMIGKKK